MSACSLDMQKNKACDANAPLIYLAQNATSPMHHDQHGTHGKPLHSDQCTSNLLSQRQVHRRGFSQSTTREALPEGKVTG